ncbi:MAG: hypothetical protein WDO69_18075 [Pseudomonadota bacterium]
MKATFGNSFAKRSLVIAVTALPSLYSGLASAQAAPPPPPPPAPVAAPAPPVAAPAPAAEPAPVTTPVPAVIAEPAANPVAPLPAPPPEAPPAPTDPDAEKYKHIDIGVWMRLTTKLQKRSDPSKLGGIGGDGEVELHMANQMRKYLAWTANFVATYNASTPPDQPSSAVQVLDLIAQFEPDPAFNLWVGRMLVPTDRSNFSGPYFMGPWNYQVFNPKEGPNGRNNGVTAWGNIAGGTLKYYLGAFNLNVPETQVLFSGRLNLSLLSPEPGFYSSSTYYGKDVLAIGVGGQYQKNGDPGAAAMPPDVPAGAPADYGLFNADVLFEKQLAGAGVLDLEGAFYKYIGDNNTTDFSYYALASYLTPKVGDAGMFQPLVRLEQGKPKGDGGTTATILDAQVGYVVDNYATRFALGFQHANDSSLSSKSNAVFFGIQLMK